MKRRVVVTGMGVVSPLGCDVDTLWRNVCAGRSGIRALTDEAFAGIRTRIAGVVADFDAGHYFTAKERRLYDRYAQFACAAARQAVDQSGLDAGHCDKGAVGIYIGSGAGGLATLLHGYQVLRDDGPARVSPHLIPMSINNMAAALVAIRTGFCGPSFAPVSACATGNHAIGEAYRAIAHGYCEAVLAGGAEAPITPLYFAAFASMRAMSTRNDAPRAASRPFDRGRDGFVMAEGAGVLVLEALAHAQSRGAPILGEIIGYGNTTDARNVTSPDDRGGARAMRVALDHAGLAPQAVDCINAHGTGTPLGDASETRAIRAVFGSHADRLKISATKSMTGHLFGAAGAVEAILTLKSLSDGLVPPTINLTDPDPACDLDYVSGSSAVRAPVGVALSNGFGFGGHNAVLAFRKFPSESVDS
ncbi:MAG: beta-ketoacyl-[acyl-carrier-protein] synthase II [Candidimonas sp.]|nr:MAG: beta-ketoacyl-[acyl-carrier-protein] synthase II [Candidimonas sp.]